MHIVIPAKAGTKARNWVPAFAGMTTRYETSTVK